MVIFKDGRIKIDLSNTSLEIIEENFKNLNIQQGGEYKPNTCMPRHYVGIIVSYRNREKSLLLFLRHIHLFLIKQNIHYAIYVVEPLANLTFNRGLLLNIGYLESLKLSNHSWDCHIYHDVDLLPEDDRNLYTCPDIPRHLSAAVSTMNYKYYNVLNY